jgi:hypothetical protein
MADSPAYQIIPEPENKIGQSYPSNCIMKNNSLFQAFKYFQFLRPMNLRAGYNKKKDTNCMNNMPYPLQEWM